MDSATQSQFLRLYARLIVSELRGRLGVDQPAETLDAADVRYLLQCAAILALEPDNGADAAEGEGHAKLWAYDVATRLAESVSGEYPGVVIAAETVLARLGNFPGLDLLRESYSGLQTPNRHAGVAIQLEALARTAENTFAFPRIGSRVLTDFQCRLLESLRSTRAVSVSAPTSAGKSFVLSHDILATCAATPGVVLVYIVPTRALIQQVTVDLLKLLRSADLSVVVSAAPIVLSDKESKRGVIYVLTQERLISLLQNEQSLPRLIKLYVDEAQEIGDVERGAILDSAVREAIRRFPEASVCFSSPLTKNPGFLFGEFDLNAEGEFFVERNPPVSQVLVNLDPVKGKTKVAVATVRTPSGIEKIGEIPLTFPFRGVHERLAGTAMLVRRHDETAIIYANRPYDAAQIAERLSDLIEDTTDDEEVADLAAFLRDHIHRSYSLIQFLRKGVAFHYGKMPHVVRTRIEDLLRKRKLRYVVCTSTLLQGVNLPAQHIVVLNPKQGNTKEMTATDFWNLAGRAGRLRESFRGMVWCIDPSNWESRPFEGERLSEIKSAFRASLEDAQVREVALAALDGTIPLTNIAIQRDRAEQLIGKAFSDFTLRDAKLSEQPKLPAQLRNELAPLDERLAKLRSALRVPERVCSLNSFISPTLLEALWNRFEAGIGSDMVPIDPFRANAINHFRKIFQIIDEVFLGINNNRWQYFGPLAYFWVMGHSLHDLIENRLKYNNVPTHDAASINAHIRDLLEAIEQTLRFTFVKYLKAYLDVLRAFLISQGRSGEAEALPPWDMYVEFGARHETILKLMSIGLSRTTSILVLPAISQASDLTREACRQQLATLPLRLLNLPNVCKEEIRSLTGNPN